MSHPSFEQILQAVLARPYFTPAEGDVNPIEVDHQPGALPVFVLTGPNGTGKSFLAKVLASMAANDFKTECMVVGMAKRTQGGVERAMIFGSEADSSTGHISLRVARTGMRTCESRTSPHILLLDEPDFGLSEGYQGALGQLLAEFATKLPAYTVAFGICTHSRRLLRHLEPLNPHHLRLGGDRLTLSQVIAGAEPDFTLAEIEALAEQSRERFQAIEKLIPKKENHGWR